MRRSIALVLAGATALAPYPAQAQARILIRPLELSFALGVQAPAPMVPAVSLSSLGRLAPLQAVAMAVPQAPGIVTADSALTTIPAGSVVPKTAEDGIEYVDLENRNRFDGTSLGLQETVSAPDGYATRSIAFTGSLPSPAELARAVQASKVVPPEIKENLSITEYKAPKDLIRGLRLRQAGFWASRVIGASAVALSIGLPAFIGAVTLTLLAASALPSVDLRSPGSSELSKEEKDILRRYISGDTRTQFFAVDNGAIAELASLGILITYVRTYHMMKGIPYGIADWALKYLKSNSHILKG